MKANARVQSSCLRQTVLVVEDSDDNRLIAATLLRWGGFKPVLARDGLEALEYLQTHLRPSVIVLDLQMPRLDGWQFLVALQAKAAWMDIPVVICSCQPTAQQEPAQPHNVVAWIDKTDMGCRLVQAVELALSLKVLDVDRPGNTQVGRTQPEAMARPY